MKDGNDGLNGNNGNNGTDGVTPQMKIENGYWYVSIDKGDTWTQYGKATGENGADGDSFFKSVTQDDKNVYFTLSDDTKLAVPKVAVLEIIFNSDGEIPLQIGVMNHITYTVTSSLTPVKVEVVTSSNIEVKVTPADADGLIGTMTARAISAINEFSKIIVMVDNGAKMIMRPLKPVGKGGPDWIDLGLPSGLKWATCNVGADNPEEYGDYFAWGEIEPNYVCRDPLKWKDGKTGYNWESYKWCDGSLTTMTKYNNESLFGPVVDNKITLDFEDDAARANWGGGWRMPTGEEFLELLYNCILEWTAQNGIYGQKITSKNNGNSIFLPAAGCYWDGKILSFAGSLGDYWSSSLRTSYPNYAWNVSFYPDNVDTGSRYRCSGLPIRPVTE